MPNTIQILNKAWEGVDPAMVTDEPPKFSFEYFPPKTEKGIENLYNKVYRMSRQNPLFLDLTWGAGGSTSELTMQMSKNFKKMFNCEVNMHLTCTNITESSVKDALVEAKEGDITSICALRGDPPVGQDKWAATDGGFNCALDLVKFIKSEYGDFFSLAVAGYPEGHPNAITEVTDVEALSETEKSRLIKLADGKLMVCTDKSFKTELDYLKAKVDAGGHSRIFVSPCRLCFSEQPRIHEHSISSRTQFISVALSSLQQIIVVFNHISHRHSPHYLSLFLYASFDMR